MEEHAIETVAPQPATKQRRPRVREVSSRFMSPMSTYSSSSSFSAATDPATTRSPLHRQQQRSTSAERQRRRQLDFEQPLRCSDENVRISKTPIHLNMSATKAALLLASSTSSTNTLRKSHQRKHSKENVGDCPQPPSPRVHVLDNAKQPFSTRAVRHTPLIAARPDTPIPTPNQRAASLDRAVPSRFRAATPAAKLLQSSGMSLPPQHKINSSQEATNSSSSDFSSSMPDGDLLPTVSNRLSNGITGSSISRSLTLPFSNSADSPFHCLKENEKPAPVVSKSFNNSLKTGNGGLCLPPIPPSQKMMGADVRKGRKLSNHQEDVHSLRMMHNRYLQWRYANARAEASMNTQKKEAEANIICLRLFEGKSIMSHVDLSDAIAQLSVHKSLYSIGVKMTDLYDSVKKKRAELGFLQRLKTSTTILEAQMPYLEEWSGLEGDYSLSLSEATQALLNASIQLPIGGNLRVDPREVQVALSSAEKMMENIVSNVLSFVPKAEEVETLTSELARVTGGERALVEECGDFLSRTYNKQMEECYLRSQIMQFHQSCSSQS
ncbi:hypothetical protein ACFE04_002917 [Oxalis oulophora]